jgi:hypothetical protein
MTDTVAVESRAPAPTPDAGRRAPDPPGQVRGVRAGVRFRPTRAARASCSSTPDPDADLRHRRARPADVPGWPRRDGDRRRPVEAGRGGDRRTSPRAMAAREPGRAAHAAGRAAAFNFEGALRSSSTQADLVDALKLSPPRGRAQGQGLEEEAWDDAEELLTRWGSKFARGSASATRPRRGRADGGARSRRWRDLHLGERKHPGETCPLCRRRGRRRWCSRSPRQPEDAPAGGCDRARRRRRCGSSSGWRSRDRRGARDDRHLRRRRRPSRVDVGGAQGGRALLPTQQLDKSGNDARRGRCRNGRRSSASRTSRPPAVPRRDEPQVCSICERSAPARDRRQPTPTR